MLVSGRLLPWMDGILKERGLGKASGMMSVRWTLRGYTAARLPIS